MTLQKLTNYDEQAQHFAKLPEYSIHCGTDFLAVRDAIKIINQITPPQKILDLGCGSGLATRYLKKHLPYANVIGADINLHMLEQATQADPHGIYIHLPTLNNEVIYPFVASKFDTIVSSFVIQENKNRLELQAFLKNIAKLLRRGGLFLMWGVYKNLFQGKWKSINVLSSHTDIKDGETYTVKLLPSDAVVQGTYWSPETVRDILLGEGCNIKIEYPLAEPDPTIDWRDETKLAPYFVLNAKKE